MANKQQDRNRINDPKVDKVWELMRERKLNITNLAKLTKERGAEISYVHLNKVLNGVKPLSFDILERIAQTFMYPTEYFLETKVYVEEMPKSRGGKELMSEILTKAVDVMRFVEAIGDEDINRLHHFFFDEPTRPLIATGHGGKFSQAVYAALLYSSYLSLGRAVTCYSCNSLSDATIQNSKILLVSKGIANIDINFIANRCADLNPEHTCSVRVKCEKDEKKAKYQKTIDKINSKCKSNSFLYDIGIEDGFISIRSVFFYMSLLYRAFFPTDKDFVSKLELNPTASENYSYESANGLESVPSLSKIKHFTVLYGSYGEPVAYNIESNIVEGGIASCMISDYKNYTHGRFLAEGNYIKSQYYPQTEAALICLVTPREANIYEELLDAMPMHLPIITIRTDLLTPLATIDLLYKGNMFVAELGEKYHGTNPNDPSNFSGIDKRVPKNSVDFEPDFKIWGALDYNAEQALLKKLNKGRTKKVKSLDEFFEQRDAILEKEVGRTIQARENWKSAKPLSWEDFSFRTLHVYDTQKQECWSFNSKTDVRDGVPLTLGNMSNTFGVSILSRDFPNSEVPYQLAIFNSENESLKIQEEIVNPENGWLTNGLKMKRKFIYSREGGTDLYWRYRRDTEFENGKQNWCYEWMKFIVWEKVKQNKGFRDILLSIPKEAVIIEQAQKKPSDDKPSMWGAWNDELLSERDIVIKSAMIENGLGKTSKSVRDVIYDVNNVGVWEGQNAMGQILTMAKLALNEGIEMPIDEEMLNNARINWFGKVLQFTKDADGKVTVRAFSPRIRNVYGYGIIGAICGDMLGSVYELDKDKKKVKNIANRKHLNIVKDMSYTDDTMLTLGVAKWLMEDKQHSKDTLIDIIKDFGSRDKQPTFSKEFKKWVKSDSREPYASGEDGCAMRVSPIGYYAETIEQCLELAKISAEVTHNGEEGIRGAKAVAAAIFLYRNGKTKEEIREYLKELFPMYDLDRTTAEIRPTYKFEVDCDKVVPESIICFLEGNDYEETVKLAISLGGDSDTMGAISGGIAAARMEVSEEYAKAALGLLTPELKGVCDEFYRKYKDRMGFEDAANMADTQDEPQDAIQEPLLPKLARAKVTVAKEKKTSQKVRKQAKSEIQSVLSEVKTEIETKEAEETTETQETTSDDRVHGIIGAVIGEVVGSRFEFLKKIPKEYELFADKCTYTDDTVLTVAVADSILHGRGFKESICDWAKRYPNAGFGARFRKWMRGVKDVPNDSIGNGSGMRVSPIGFHAKSLEEALEQARQSAIISHDSVEGIKGAQTIAAATFLAKQQTPKEEIKAYIESNFGYNLHMTEEEVKTFVSKLRHGDKKKGIPNEREFAENTCPLAIIAFLVTDDYESAIRKAISYNCDTDTVACMTGGIAAAYYGVPKELVDGVANYLQQDLIDIINEFDGINLQITERITPKEFHRWGGILVYGTGDNKNNETEGYMAMKNFRATDKLEGIDHNAYGIPTVGRSLDEIKAAVDRFIEYAETNKDKTFLVSQIGCSKAEYTPKQIAPMFEKAKTMTNVYLPKVFIEVPETWEKKKRKIKEK